MYVEIAIKQKTEYCFEKEEDEEWEATHNNAASIVSIIGVNL